MPGSLQQARDVGGESRNCRRDSNSHLDARVGQLFHRRETRVRRRGERFERPGDIIIVKRDRKIDAQAGLSGERLQHVDVPPNQS